MEIRNRLKIFADEVLERYFEKQGDSRYWRQQLNVEFKGNDKIWFGNLYFNGGKRAEISWDSNFIFKIDLYHLSVGIKEKILEEFKQLLREFHFDCYLLSKEDTLEKLKIIPFGQIAEFSNGIFSNFKQISYYIDVHKNENRTFICTIQNDERIPIYIRKQDRAMNPGYHQGRSIIITI